MQDLNQKNIETGDLAHNTTATTKLSITQAVVETTEIIDDFSFALATWECDQILENTIEWDNASVQLERCKRTAMKLLKQINSLVSTERVAFDLSPNSHDEDLFAILNQEIPDLKKFDVSANDNTTTITNSATTTVDVVLSKDLTATTATTTTTTAVDDSKSPVDKCKKDLKRKRDESTEHIDQRENKSRKINAVDNKRERGFDRNIDRNRSRSFSSYNGYYPQDNTFRPNRYVPVDDRPKNQNHFASNKRYDFEREDFQNRRTNAEDKHLPPPPPPRRRFRESPPKDLSNCHDKIIISTRLDEKKSPSKRSVHIEKHKYDYYAGYNRSDRDRRYENNTRDDYEKSKKNGDSYGRRNENYTPRPGVHGYDERNIGKTVWGEKRSDRPRF